MNINDYKRTTTDRSARTFLVAVSYVYTTFFTRGKQIVGQNPYLIGCILRIKISRLTLRKLVILIVLYRIYYLRQGGYVFARLCLFVCKGKGRQFV